MNPKSKKTQKRYHKGSGTDSEFIWSWVNTIEDLLGLLCPGSFCLVYVVLKLDYRKYIGILTT